MYSSGIKITLSNNKAVGGALGGKLYNLKTLIVNLEVSKERAMVLLSEHDDIRFKNLVKGRHKRSLHILESA